MNTSFVKTGCIAVFTVVAGCVSVARAENAIEQGKNVASAHFINAESDGAEFFRNHSDWFDFNFRPYNQSTEFLWTDPKVQRDVAAGKTIEGKRPTAIAFTVDARTFNVWLFCGEPSMTEGYAKSADFPSPFVEFFPCPGDSDTEKIQHHYHMYYSGSELKEFPWMEADREFRKLLPYTTVEEFALSNGVMLKITYQWDGMWDYLPFVVNTKKDCFWRFSAIRWAADGGQTWGGRVHDQTGAGYVRFPDFTAGQKSAIMGEVLRRGWKKFRNSYNDYNYALGNGMPFVTINTNMYYRETLAKSRRSFVNYAEDPEFRPELVRIIRECDDLGPELAKFTEMGEGEQIEFYKRASAKLFNFEYDVADAYAKLEKDRLARHFEPTKVADYVAGDRDVKSGKLAPDRRNAFDLDKLESELKEIPAKIADAKDAAARAKLEYRKAELEFVLAKNDKPEDSLNAMFAAATAKDVPALNMVDMLVDLALFRRSKWRLYNDTFDFERDAWKELEKRPEDFAKAEVRFRYYDKLLNSVLRYTGNDWRTDIWRTREEFSDEHKLAVVERMLADKVIAADTGKGPRWLADATVQKAMLLFNMERDAEAEKTMMDAIAGCSDDSPLLKIYRSGLAGLYIQQAKRYESDSHVPTLEKALKYADGVQKADILFEMKRYAEAEEIYTSPVSKAKCAYARGDYEKAVQCYGEAFNAPKSNMKARDMLDYARALHALGRDDEAKTVLEKCKSIAYPTDKKVAIRYISILEK